MITAAELVAKVSVQGADLAQSALQSVGDAFISAADAAAKFIVGSVTMAGDFQQSTNTLITSAGLSRTSIDAVRQGILQMSIDTATSTDQLVQGMFNVQSALHLGAGGLLVLKAAAEGAKAENSDLAQTTDVLTTAMVNFHIPASQAVATMDSLIVTVADGKMHMNDLTGSLRNVLPVAAAFHIQLSDVEGALATMANAGDRGTIAGTHLAMMFKMLESPASTARKEMAAMGIDSIKLAQTLNTSLPDALKMIQDSVSKHFTPGSVEYNRAIQTILGGSKSGVAGLEIFNQGLKALGLNVSDASAALRKGGKDVENWSVIQSNFNFQLEAAQNAVSALMIKIGSALLPVLGQLFQAVTPTITAFTQWIDKSHILQDVAKTLSGWIGYIGQGFNDVFNPIKKATDVMKPLTDSFDRATGIIKPLKEALTPLTDTFDRANGIIHSTSNAVNPMLDSFDRATGVFQKTNAQVKDAPNAWVPFWTAVKNLRDQIMHIDWGAVGQGFNNIGSAISKMDWGKVGKFFTDTGTAIKNVDWGKVGKSLQDIAIGFTKVDWGKVGEAIVNIAKAMANIDWKKIGDGIKSITDGLSKVDWGLVMQGINIAIQGIQGVFGMFNWLYDVLLGHSIIPDLINGIVKWFTDLGPRALGAINTFISNVGKAFGGLISSAFGWGSSLISNIISGIQSVSGNINTTLHNLHIPGYASGTSFAPGGMAVVGERGPELMYVPRGAQIIPNHQISQVSGQSSSSSSASSTPIILQLDGYQFARIVMPHIVNAVRSNVGIVGF